ncbi:MAG: nucleotidyltransferase domain-containing protein [Anaerolineales bacterium]|nr:nucleotidyltransferase domain-containing protein [Anaerolineales bacterium]
MTLQLTALLQPNEQAAINSFLKRLQNEHGDRVFDSVLFGSKARGDSQPESDIDILLIVDHEDWRFRHQISDIASGIALEYDVLIGSFIIAQERWEQMKRERFSLCENVARDGIPLPLGTD